MWWVNNSNHIVHNKQVWEYVCCVCVCVCVCATELSLFVPTLLYQPQPVEDD